MPTEWQYYADGVNTAVSTAHSLDGSLKSVTVQLSSFRHRLWTEEELDGHPAKKPENMSYSSEDDAYGEYADGAHATLRFDVDDGGKAHLDSIEPEDGDLVEPRHMMLLPAAERVVEQLDGVRAAFTFDPLRRNYEGAVDAGVFIERLDG